jgi:hypothetical protein
MLNLKKTFSVAGKKNEAENFEYFENDVFFEKKTSPFKLFVLLDLKKHFLKLKTRFS